MAITTFALAALKGCATGFLRTHRRRRVAQAFHLRRRLRWTAVALAEAVRPASGRRVLLAIMMAALAPIAIGAQNFATLADPVKAFVSVPETSIALTHVRVVDGTGTPPREDQTIVIQNGKITAVTPASAARVPAG